MNYRWLIALSIVGIIVGIFIFLDNFIFFVWMCSCLANYCPPCPAPFSYYLYTYYIPVAIIGVSVVTLVWSLLVQKRLHASRIESMGRSHE